MNASLIDQLKKHDQSHLLRFAEQLSPKQLAAFEKQLAELDFDSLDQLIRDYVLKKPEVTIPADLKPAPYFPLVPRDAAQKALYEKARRRGTELLSAGKVACLIVAGGQGTRLGFDGPKGTYPIGPVTDRTLFQTFAEAIRRTQTKYGCTLDWYIMTSLLNDKATRDFFAAHQFFGLKPEQVFFFTQGTMPAIGYDGKLLLGAKDSLALSPDGHGGTLLALRRSGALDRMAAKGVEYLSYFQVDNPLVGVANPLFIGLHDLENSEMSAIMLAKTNAFEKLGNFCVSDGKLQIIEYSDLPAELAESRDEKGQLRFVAGSPAIHVLSRCFVERLTAGGNLKLPFHRADKKVPFVDEAGNPVAPETPNAVKLEAFIFDALPLAKKTMVLEGKREDVFGPTKNKTGVDSAESCRLMLTDRAARYLEAAGIAVPRKADGTVDAVIELSPLAGIDAEDVSEYVKHHKVVILPGSQVVLA